MTYGAVKSIVYWRGIAAAYIFCCGVPSVSVFFKISSVGPMPEATYRSARSFSSLS